jgi:nitrite reductase/ring-hydroxylating ferredoxin subunit
MEEELEEINGYKECFSKFDSSQIYKAASKHCQHLACPVPSGIIKGIEVACGLALPKDVEINIEK